MVETKLISRIVWSVLTTVQVGSAAQQLSNIPRQDFWVTDGAVNAIAVTNDRVFIGGDFRYVGPYTGGGVPIDVNTMQPVAKYPKVNGSVHAVEPDGQGGWFIGGGFTTVGGRPRTNLAHITATGEVNTNWVAQATGGAERGRVSRLVLEGATLYVGGTFTNLGGLLRPYAGAVDPGTGAVKPWAPQPDSEILAMAVSPTAVYLAGKFSSLGGLARRYVGATDKTTGQALAWNPWDPAVNPLLVALTETSVFPFAITVLDGWVIFPGRFGTPFATVNLAAFNATTAAWAWGRGGAEQVYDLEVQNNKLYVAGQFSEIGGDGTAGAVPKKNLAELDPAIGMRVTGWNPQLNIVGAIRSLAFHNNSVFIVGDFGNPNPFDDARTNADHIAQVDLTSGSLVGTARPFNNGRMWAVAAQGEELFLGGAFTSVAGIQHGFLAELSLRDGSLQSWKPKINNGVAGSVSALAVANGRLLVGGAFGSLDGQPRQGLAAYYLDSMQLTDWNPQVERDTALAIDPAITRILPHDGQVFVAGDFYAINGQSRSNLAKLDLANGQVLDWRADANSPVEAIEAAGGHVYLGGRFTTIGGIPRPYLARVGINLAAVDAWAPQPNFWVTDLSANSNAIYISGRFDSIAGQGRRGTAAFLLETGELLPWNVDSLVGQLGRPVGWPIHATDAAVYSMGGYFPGPDFRDLVELTPYTADVGTWDTRTYSFSSPKRVLKASQRLFVIGRLNAIFGPTRHGLVVYEPEGFSVFHRPERQGNTTKLGLTVDQGRQVVVERTTNFNTWTGVATNIAWEGNLQLQDASAPASGAYYRAQTSQP